MTVSEVKVILFSFLSVRPTPFAPIPVFVISNLPNLSSDSIVLMSSEMSQIPLMTARLSTCPWNTSLTCTLMSTTSVSPAMSSSYSHVRSLAVMVPVPETVMTSSSTNSPSLVNSSQTLSPSTSTCCAVIANPSPRSSDWPVLRVNFLSLSIINLDNLSGLDLIGTYSSARNPSFSYTCSSAVKGALFQSSNS